MMYYQLSGQPLVEYGCQWQYKPQCHMYHCWHCSTLILEGLIRLKMTYVGEGTSQISQVCFMFRCSMTFNQSNLVKDMAKCLIKCMKTVRELGPGPIHSQSSITSPFPFPQPWSLITIVKLKPHKSKDANCYSS